MDTDDHRAVCVNKLLIQFAPSLTREHSLPDGAQNPSFRLGLPKILECFASTLGLGSRLQWQKPEPVFIASLADAALTLLFDEFMLLQEPHISVDRLSVHAHAFGERVEAGPRDALPFKAEQCQP